MMDTILFDLDGTLLPIDTDDFIARYFEALSLKLIDYFTKEEVSKVIWSSTMSMIQNTDPNKTNQQVFFEAFFQQVDHSVEILNPIFDDFYENEFNLLQEGIKKEGRIIDSIELLKEKGYDLIIATNPLFPKKAVEERIKWAGLNHEDFSYFTSYEFMHSCKPNIEFYEEVLEKTKTLANKALMVGNDVKEDMIIKDLGVQTYLIEDFIIGELGNKEKIDYHGSYEDFYEFCLQLPIL